jgi:hypothetical protein
MARRKHHTPERVVNLLRQIEVAVAQGKTIAVAWTIPLSDFTIGVPLATTERYLLKELPSSDVRLDSLNHYERDDPNSGWTPKQVDLDSAGEPGATMTTLPSLVQRPSKSICQAQLA